MQYASSVSSAEWIEEAPFARRRVLPISQFGSLTFTLGLGSQGRPVPDPADLNARAISLVDENGRAAGRPVAAQPRRLGLYRLAH